MRSGGNTTSGEEKEKADQAMQPEPMADNDAPQHF
jgi:hypothetical protein